MIPSNFRIKILAFRTLLCALGTKGLKSKYKRLKSQVIKVFFQETFSIEQARIQGVGHLGQDLLDITNELISKFLSQQLHN